MSDAAPDSQTLQWIIASGAVLFAIACALWSIYEGMRRRTISKNWQDARRVMELTISRADILFQSDPDLTLIWDEGAGDTVAGIANTGTARQPLQVPDHVLGQAKILEIAANDDEDAPSVGAAKPPVGERFETFLAYLTDTCRARFAEAVDRLRGEGQSFCLTLDMQNGQVIEASGRPAAAQSVVKLRDVSPERSEIERLTELLRASEVERESLTEILNRAPFPVWRRKGHTITWVNEAYANAVEAANPQDAVERRMELESSERALAALASREHEVKTRRRYVVIGGERRAVNLIAVPAADGTGGIALDMSAVDDAESQLERHIDAHKETLDKLQTGVAIFGGDTKLVFFNDAYARLWDLDRRWLAQMPTEEEILEHLRARRRLPEQADFKSWKKERMKLYQELVDSDDLWHLPDGRTLRVVTRAHPFGGLIYLYEDVTDQLSLESSYNTLINVQSATLDHLHEAVAVFGSDGRLKLTNAAFAEMWELPRALLKDEPHFREVTDVAHRQLEDMHMEEGGEWSRIAACITDVSAKRKLEPGRLHRRDGRILDFAAEPLPDGRILLTFLDVSDTATIERVLRERNEALETADRLKSEFISNVSYQLRTPLNSIIGFGEMLDEGFVGDLNDRQSEYVDHILHASGQLRDMVNDILDLAMIEAGTISLDLDEVDIAELLENAKQAAVTRAADSELVVNVECAEDIGMITADGRRLRQILFNLTSNAIRFSDGEGTITIGATRAPTGVDLWVKDTGQGIPNEYQSSVFERFATLDSDRRGAGLGLSLVKSFVELHGGGVTLESEPAKGTRVICHLPDHSQMAEQAAE